MLEAVDRGDAERDQHGGAGDHQLAVAQFLTRRDHDHAGRRDRGVDERRCAYVYLDLDLDLNPNANPDLNGDNLNRRYLRGDTAAIHAFDSGPTTTTVNFPTRHASACSPSSVRSVCFGAIPLARCTTYVTSSAPIA